MKNLLLSTAIAIAAFAVSVQSQQPIDDAEPTLIKLPKAINPKDGYTGGGPVNVRVTVNEKGEVTNAEFVSGPGPVCDAITRPDVVKTRQTAVDLARQARFAPATSGDQPVARITTLSIKFAEPTPKQQKASKDSIYGAQQDTNFSPAQAPEKAAGDSASKADTAKSDAAHPTYTMQPDANAARGEIAAIADGQKTISGGVLNGRAMTVPKPIYPAAARAVHAFGAVQVQVLIDGDGNVFLAQAVSGHPLLQSASVVAACKAKFTPTLFSGQPVKVSGIITYNFVP